jgi:predicted dehydrogenase
METLKIGIIGAGGIAKGQTKTFRENPETEVVAITEPSAASLETFKEVVYPDAEPPTVYDDHKEMLDSETLDAVLIASPHSVHFTQIMDSLDRGLHILSEKPMVCSTDETIKVVEKARQVDRHIVVGYQRRFDRKYRYIREFVQSPSFGNIHCVFAFQSQSWLWSQKGKWRQNPALSCGGQLNDSASHLIDMLFWMIGDRVTEVSAFIDNRGTDVDIDSAVSFKTARGALGNLSIMGSATASGMNEDITISGDNGRSVFLRSGELQINTELQGPLTEVTDFGDCTDGEKVQHFIDVVRGKAKNESPPESFLNVIEFTEACWKSATAGGTPVAVPQTTI